MQGSKSVKRFDENVVLVTGAGQGIGRAAALRFAMEGASVIVVDRAEAPARAVVETICNAGGTAFAAIHDLEHNQGAMAMATEVRERFGRLDVAVHNVGGTIWAKPFWEYAPAEIEAEIQRSLWPTLWCCHAILPLMMAAGTGSIVNVGSVATRGINRVPYAAAKGGVSAITTTLALELADHGIRVNCIAPGGVDGGTRITPRNIELQSQAEVGWMNEVVDQTLRDTPMGRFGTPDELAAAICFLASSEASYITGQTLCVAGGGIG